MELSKRADRQLVPLARAGDDSAFAVLFDRHAAAVFQHARQHGQGPAGAAAVTRDVFVRASRSLAHPAAEQGFGHWIRSLAVDRTASSPLRAGGLTDATRAALEPAGGQLTPALRDAIWHEVMRSRPEGRAAIRRRSAILAGGLLVLAAAVGVVGLRLWSEVRPEEPPEVVTLTPEAVAVEPSASPIPPPVAPSVIAPPPPTDSPTAEETTPSPSPTPTPEPTPEPSPSPTDAPPSATISAPEDGESFEAEQGEDGGWYATVDLAGSGSDAEDDAAGLALSYSWTSDRDGALAAEPTATVRLSLGGECPVATPTTHTLTLAVTDSAGQTASADVSVTVRCPVL